MILKNMFLEEKRKWVEPIELAKRIPKEEQYWALLYSGLKTDYSGKYSFLALKPKKEIRGRNVQKLKQNLTSNKKKLSNAWFGYLGYGLKNSLEKLPKDKESYLNFPDLWMLKYSVILVFDHQSKKIEVWSESKFDFDVFFKNTSPSSYRPLVKDSLKSNMSCTSYIEKVKRIKEAILSGDVYQANLTRKFFGEFTRAPDSLSLFEELCKISPSPYSCLMKFNNSYVISSSPEQFLSISKSGYVETRPIKGTAPRFSSSVKDRKSKETLKKSSKNRSENLMIVDLMRNDLSRSCKTGSIKVKSLFDITSYSTLHHMSSVITGTKKNDISTLDLTLGCFPPGSMTGAPKIKAMELCSKMEKHKRGVYSGAIGWFGGDGSADLSVVIRTLIMKDNKFEFQVGGAIVADSIPEEELEETITKASALLKILNIKKSEIKNI